MESERRPRTRHGIGKVILVCVFIKIGCCLQAMENRWAKRIRGWIQTEKIDEKTYWLLASYRVGTLKIEQMTSQNPYVLLRVLRMMQMSMGGLPKAIVFSPIPFHQVKSYIRQSPNKLSIKSLKTNQS